MSMRLASYTGTRPGFAGLFNRLCRWWLHGPYSHSELVFSDGMCASCSWLDGGARLKRIEFEPARWDLVEIDATPEQEAMARALVEQSIASPAHRPRYSLMLLAAFAIPPLRRLLGPRDQVCSTYIAWALGIPSYMQHDPCELAALLAER